MKKLIPALLCLPLLCGILSALCSCRRTEETETGPAAGDTISVFCDLKDARIWILPQTEAILKTTLWGTATVRTDADGGEEEIRLSLDALGGPGVYIVRIISSRGALFSANDVPLADHAAVKLTNADRLGDALIEVLDEAGNVLFSEPAFEGMLGAAAG